MRINAVISQAEFIDEIRRKSVNFADGRAAIRIVLVSGRKATAIQEIREWARSEDGLILVTETDEEVVAGGKSVINADIKVVLIKVLFGGYVVVVPANVESRQRGGEQRSQPRGYRIDGTSGNHVRGHAASGGCHRKSAHAIGEITARSDGLRQVRIENFPLVGLVAAAVENVQSADRINNWRVQIQEAREITGQLFGPGKQQKLWPRLPDAQAFVVDKEERTVLDDRPAEGSAVLVLLIRLPPEEVEGIPSVQLIVAEKLVGVAVK